MGRKIYLEDIPLGEAKERLTAVLRETKLWQPLGSETIPLTVALGRITAAPIWAKISSPHYHGSAMDGFAVRAADSVGAMETKPILLHIVHKDEAWQEVERPAQPVNTGHPLPEWADGVIMVEHTQPVAAGIMIYQPIAPWQHVRLLGEDMVATELVLPANHQLRPVDLGAVAGSGHGHVVVYRQPRVAIIPTGSELIQVEEVDEKGVEAGQIIEYNSLILGAQVEGWGGRATRMPIVLDQLEQIKQAVREAAEEHDLVLINAGSSAGTEDYTAAVVSELGTLLVHGVAVRPGHPVILGVMRVKERTVVLLGVPGYPVSATLTGEIFIRPLLARWLGQSEAEPELLEAEMSRKLNSPMGDDDFVRVTVGEVGGRMVATPLQRGAGVISSLVRADGLVQIPRFKEGVEMRERVKVQLYRPLEQVKKTILLSGSHDLTIDLLAQEVASLGTGWRLSAGNIGSIGGLVALRRGEAHLVGAHLLDPETGTFNVPYIEKYLKGERVQLVTMAHREQGWIVPKGNPKGLVGWEDGRRAELRFINRQRGAGTRLLLDYYWEQKGIDGAKVSGYEQEAYTHLAVAATVQSGRADYGLGVMGAARALGLDFVPLSSERYELVMLQTVVESGLLDGVLGLLNSARFKQLVESVPGYDAAEMGVSRVYGPEYPVV